MCIYICIYIYLYKGVEFFFVNMYLLNRQLYIHHVSSKRNVEYFSFIYLLFVYEMVPSVVAETAFLRDLENDLL